MFTPFAKQAHESASWRSTSSLAAASSSSPSLLPALQDPSAPAHSSSSARAWRSHACLNRQLPLHSAAPTKGQPYYLYQELYATSLQEAQKYGWHCNPSPGSKPLQ